MVDVCREMVRHKERDKKKSMATGKPFSMQNRFDIIHLEHLEIIDFQPAVHRPESEPSASEWIRVWMVEDHDSILVEPCPSSGGDEPDGIVMVGNNPVSRRFSVVLRE